MKVLLSTTMLLGFIASAGINQASGFAAIQPIAPLTHQGQLIHVRGEGVSTRHTPIRAHHHRGIAENRSGTAAHHCVHHHRNTVENRSAAVTHHRVHHHRSPAEHRSGATTHHRVHHQRNR